MWKLAQIDTSGIGRSLPQPGVDDISLLQVIFNLVFAITATIGVLIIVVAGVRLMLSRGDPQAVTKARNTILYVAVGLIVMSLAYAIVGVALGVLGGDQ
jgi:Na+-driven multidrug efflux pump